jgi:uncharacterized protein (TIGR02271 family)
MKETRRKQYAANEAADQITRPQRGLWTGQRVGLAIATVAGLALASGCCSGTRTSASYSPPPSTAYARMPEPAPAPAAARVETAATGDIVVPLHQETLNVGKREVDTGSVTLKKIVKTETVNQPVELRREEIVIDRNNNTGESAANKILAQPFTEEQTTIPLKREEAVINKQTVPAGEVVIHKRWTTEQQNATAQVRREDIDTSGLNQPGVTISQNFRNTEGTTAVGGATTPGGTATGYATSDTEIITDPGTITVETAPQYKGRHVKFQHMKVHKVYGDRLYEISSDNGRPFYVVTEQPAPNALHEGDTVLITGKVKERGATVTGLNEEGSKVLMQQPYYIEVQKIETAPNQ